MRKLIGIAAFLFLAACSVWAYAQTFPGQFTCATNTLMNAVGATGTPSCRALTSADLTGTNAVTAAGNTAFTGNNTFAGTSAFNNTVSGTGITSLFASPPPIGNTVASTGAFTTLGASGAFTASTTATVTGVTKLNGNAIFGGGEPWVDVKSGANSCAAAVGNSSNDDTSAIQCQINFMQSTFGGGIVFLPCGTYKVTSTVVVSKTNILLFGEGLCTGITTSGADITALGYGSTAAQMHWAGFSNLQVLCNLTSGATKDCVEVDNCVNCTFRDFQVWGGNHALFICGSTNCNVANPATGGGGDSVFINAFISGWGSGGGALLEYNSGNWFFNIKADTAGQTTAVAVNLNTDASSPSSVQESSFYRLDMSGSYTTSSLSINDGGSARSTVMMFHPVISSGYVLGTFRHLSILGGELGTGTFNITSGNLAIAGSAADSGGGGAITFTNTAGTRSCAANIGVTC